MKAKKTQSGKAVPCNSPAVPAYGKSLNAANTGSRPTTKGTGVYSGSGASLPQDANPHPKEFGLGKKSKSLI